MAIYSRTGYKRSFPKRSYRTASKYRRTASGRRRTGYGRGYGRRRVGQYRRYQGSGGTEIKYIDQSFDRQIRVVANTDNSNYGRTLMSTLHGITQGAGPSQRIGKRVNITKIMFRFFLRPTDVNIDNDASGLGYRFMIIQDMQCNGTAPTPFAVLDEAAHVNFSDTGLPAAADDTPTKQWVPGLAFNDLSNISRFKILVDKMFLPTPMLNGNGAKAYSYKPVFLKKVIKCNIPVEFNTATTSGSVTDMRSNNIFAAITYMTPYPDQNLNIAQLKLYTRVRYSDA